MMSQNTAGSQTIAYLKVRNSENEQEGNYSKSMHLALLIYGEIPVLLLYNAGGTVGGHS